MTEASAAALVDWFRANCRELSMRTPHPRDPYPVLVSEVMAQQTQIDRVVPAFDRFMELFPDAGSLAAAPEDEVLQAWSGLGYYRRARLLHTAVRAVVAAGEWPRTRAELARLPGLGPYTSAAVAAFCFGGDDPPVDGNVERVTARVLGLDLSLASGPLRRAADAFARDLWRAHPGPEVFEAVMELGATVCTPSAPRCPECPLAPGCQALRRGTPGLFPRPRPQRATEDRRWVCLWLPRDDGRVLLRRVADGTLLAGLWLPPLADAGVARNEDAARRLAVEAGVAGPLVAAPPVRHSITHRRITVVPFVASTATPMAHERAANWSWEDPAAPAVATSSLLAKLRRACADVSTLPRP
ncbi:MAG: A/G-specific adenine glycosylase [Acidobacteria bacterium]|nr:A/G-specific adenine glycosylase [Acidobacteriota bacterium]